MTAVGLERDDAQRLHDARDDVLHARSLKVFVFVVCVCVCCLEVRVTAAAAALGAHPPAPTWISWRAP